MRSGLRHSVERIAPGLAGTDKTVSRLIDLVNDSIHSGVIRLRALEILNQAGVVNGDQLQAARALYRWVKQNIRYIPDPVNLETIQQPEITYCLQAGDCDDHSALIAAFAHAIGIPARFRVVGDTDRAFKHIWAELQIGGRWYPADTTNPAGFGHRPGRFLAEKTYSNNGGVAMSGLSGAQTVSQIPRRVFIAAAYQGAANVLRRNWSQGKINRDDLLGYLQVIDGGDSPSRGTFADAPMRQAIADFLAEVDRRGAVSGKPRATLNGLEGLEGFLGSVWGGVKGAVSAVVPGGAAVVGAAESLFRGKQEPGSYWNRLAPIQVGQVMNPGSPPVDAKYAPKINAAWQHDLTQGTPRPLLWDNAPRGAWEQAQQAIMKPYVAPPRVPLIQVPPGLIQTQVSPEAARAGAMEMMQSPVVLIGIGLLAVLALGKFGKAGK